MDSYSWGTNWTGYRGKDTARPPPPPRLSHLPGKGTLQLHAPSFGNNARLFALLAWATEPGWTASPCSQGCSCKVDFPAAVANSPGSGSILDMHFLSHVGLCPCTRVSASLLRLLFFLISFLCPLCSRGCSSHTSETELQSFKATDDCLAEPFQRERLGVPQHYRPRLQQLGLAGVPVSLCRASRSWGSWGGSGCSFTFLTFKAPGWPAQGPGEMPSALLSTWAPT